MKTPLPGAVRLRFAAKERAARALCRVGADRLAAAIEWRLQRPHIRALYYHDVPARFADAFASQLAWFKERYEPVSLEDLRRFQAGTWRPRRPGLILTFDDGLRSHAEVAAPLLEAHGFTGWFFVPTGFVSCPEADQQAYAARSMILHEEERPRVAMTWEQARALAARHVVGCHTATHVRLSAALGPERLRAEIVDAKHALEERLATPVTTFSWVGGEEYAYSAEAAAWIREAGFEFAFMTNTAPNTTRTDPLQLQRTHVEASHSPDVVRLQVSGLMDLYYWPKRRRVNAVTRPLRSH